MARRTKNVMYSPGGWVAEVYEDDDGGSGLGDEAAVGYWYGTREECDAVSPDEVTLHPVPWLRAV